MANPTPITHTTPLERHTVGKIVTYCAALAGRTALETHEQTQVIQFCNDEQEYWRGFMAGINGFSDQIKDYEWAGGGGDDPASGDTQLLLPADFAELKDGCLYLLDSNDKVFNKVPMIEEKDWRRQHFEGETPYIDEDRPVAFFRLQATSTQRRIVQIDPEPDDGVKIRVPYYAYAEKLDSTDDIIEAPAKAHAGIKAGVAYQFLDLYGGEIEAFKQKAKRDAILQELIGNPRRRENPKPRRARFFTERTVGGYPGFRPDTPS